MSDNQMSALAPQVRPWQRKDNYTAGDVVIIVGERFVCVIPHVSKTFGNEFFDELMWRQDRPRSKPGRYERT